MQSTAYIAGLIIIEYVASINGVQYIHQYALMCSLCVVHGIVFEIKVAVESELYLSCYKNVIAK